ncbi:MAG TPA: aminotransferase class V-fold PLP-dependent enzyme [Candidatus Tripitaka californicus]|uniref:aminotransferase class V-fold PLP-dependent enzyme n=1 Tax=Candidatus Tripitaka californicus TaxID=3367616 RepID=UPI0040281D6E
MIYLDNAATSFPKPSEVYGEMDEFFRERAANPGRAGYRVSTEAEKGIEMTRKALAGLFGASEPQRLVFTLNATDAINMAIKGLLNPGDHVITTTLEHNAVTRPLNSLERQGVITVTRVRPSPQGFLDPGDIKRAITHKTRLVALVHASNVLGTVQPIGDVGRLARERDLLFLVDAAQSAGLWPVNVEEQCIDLLAFTGHKSLFGPPGTGGLYVGGRVELRPWREGGTGVDSQNPVQPEDMPFRLEGGTPNFVGLAGLKAGVEFVSRTGTDKIRRHGQALTSQLLHALGDDTRFTLYGPPPEAEVGGGPATSPILSLNIRGMEPQVVGTILDESFGIAVRSGLHCAPGTHKEIGSFPQGTVRISPGFFNTGDDIAQVALALKEIASSTAVSSRQ